jgi:SH3-like domain-containing protein
MSIKNLKFFLLLLLMPFFIFSCGDDEENGDEDVTYEDVIEEDGYTEEDVANEEVNIICMWKAVSLREEPSSKGKYVTTMYLGESGTTYGETVTDSSSSKVREYVKITLGDGTEGWIQKNLTEIDVIPYAVKSTTKLYQRPDILASSKKEFETMQFVVVTETQDDWMKIKGKKPSDGWFSEGWVKSTHLSSSDIDITVAILAERALAKDGKEKKMEALQEILDNPDLSGSVFIPSLRDIVDEMMYSDDPEEEVYD